ncbi:MAG: DUF6119 family protein, partial [Pseudonocardiales bacterium]
MIAEPVSDGQQQRPLGARGVENGRRLTFFIVVRLVGVARRRTRVRRGRSDAITLASNCPEVRSATARSCGTTLRSSYPPFHGDASPMRWVPVSVRPADFLVSGTIAPGDADWCAPLGGLVGMTVAEQNQTSLALLLVRTDKAVYGLTFGLGHLMIDQARIDPGFGIEQFGEIVSQISGQIAGVPLTFTQDRNRPAHVTGSDRSIKLHLGTTPAGLLHDLQHIEQVCTRPSPLPEFEFIAQVRPLNPKSERALRLDDRLDEMLSGTEVNRLALAVPSDCRDRFEFAESFSIALAGRSQQVGKLDVNDLIGAVAEKPEGQRLRALRQGRIQMFADTEGADRISRNVPVDHWLTAEVSDGVVHYFYWQGQWYEIGAEYLTVIESRIAELLDRPSSVAMPPWP